MHRRGCLRVRSRPTCLGAHQLGLKMLPLRHSASALCLRQLVRCRLAPMKVAPKPQEGLLPHRRHPPHPPLPRPPRCSASRHLQAILCLLPRCSATWFQVVGVDELLAGLGQDVVPCPPLLHSATWLSGLRPPLQVLQMLQLCCRRLHLEVSPSQLCPPPLRFRCFCSPCARRRDLRLPPQFFLLW